MWYQQVISDKYKVCHINSDEKMVSTKKGMAQVTTNKNCTASFRNRILAQNDLKCPNHKKKKKKWLICIGNREASREYSAWQAENAL